VKQSLLVCLDLRCSGEQSGTFAKPRWGCLAASALPHISLANSFIWDTQLSFTNTNDAHKVRERNTRPSRQRPVYTTAQKSIHTYEPPSHKSEIVYCILLNTKFHNGEKKSSSTSSRLFTWLCMLQFPAEMNTSGDKTLITFIPYKTYFSPDLVLISNTLKLKTITQAWTVYVYNHLNLYF